MIIVASSNANKIKEIREIFGCDVYSAFDFGVNIDVEENANTFSGNARLKARAFFNELKTKIDSNFVVLADDSGLCVDELNGDPGVKSARYANLDSNIESNASDIDNNAKVINELNLLNKTESSARFVCSIVAVGLDSNKEFEFSALGDCNGVVITQERGKNGFGYDSIFIPDGFNKTLGELESSVKNSISHRKKALDIIKQKLLDSGFLKKAESKKINFLFQNPYIKKLLLNSAIIYGLVGVVNTFVCWVVMFSLMYFGAIPEIANVFGYIVGFLNSYLLNKKFTFKSNNSHKQDFIRFGVAMGIAYVANFLALLLLYRGMGVNEYISQILATIVYTIVGYLISRFWAFKR